MEKHFIRDASAITSAVIPYHSNHSVSTKKKNTAFSSAHSWAFSAERLAFLAGKNALVDTQPNTTDLEHGIFFAVYAGLESSRISSKISLFVSWRWTKVLRVWNDMRASN